MLLNINKKHCSATVYDSLKDDAVARAIKQQYPDIHVKRVYEDYFIDTAGQRYSISSNYNRNSFYDVRNGITQSLQVEFQPSS